jgi:hypothetical protein
MKDYDQRANVEQHLPERLDRLSSGCLSGAFYHLGCETREINPETKNDWK